MQTALINYRKRDLATREGQSSTTPSVLTLEERVKKLENQMRLLAETYVVTGSEWSNPNQPISDLEYNRNEATENFLREVDDSGLLADAYAAAQAAAQYFRCSLSRAVDCRHGNRTCPLAKVRETCIYSVRDHVCWSGDVVETKRRHEGTATRVFYTASSVVIALDD